MPARLNSDRLIGWCLNCSFKCQVSMKYLSMIATQQRILTRGKLSGRLNVEGHRSGAFWF